MSLFIACSKRTAAIYARFCVTGTPRSRTAWLSALFVAHGIETLHEYNQFFRTLDELGKWLYEGTEEAPHGYVDGFSIINHAGLLAQHFAGFPIVVIHRNHDEVRKSWAKWRGEISDTEFSDAERKVAHFCATNEVLNVPYEDLKKYECVNGLVTYCTGRALKFRTWQLFDRLKIEVKDG